jgi:formylglycine-generating enzyme required for sulfatase activity
LAERLIVLIGRLNNLFGELPCIQFLDRMRRNAIAWSGGRLVVKDVDYENFAPGIRVEHFADTLKRLADAAYAPRAQHLRPQQCLASSQAIFWFTELPQGAIDFDWLSATRFSFELFGGAVAGRAPDIQFAPRQNVAESLVRDFLDSFVEVPAGTYLLGSETEAKISEPPAERVSASIRGFRILKRPVTGTDWQLFSTTSLGTGSSELLPVTQCTAFQAFLFAKQVEEVLRRFNFIADCERVLLPSEQQWEAAARGPQAYEYPWGNVFQELHCNCDQKFGLMPTVPGRFSPAGDSPFGCQDMAGNVREWTRSYGGISGVDWRKNSEVPLLRTFERLRPTDRLIIRGGSYSYEFDCVRTWVRNTQLAERKDLQTGFRIVIDRLPA